MPSLFPLVLLGLCSLGCSLIQAQTAAPATETDLNALVSDSLRFLEHGKNKSVDYACTVRNHRKQFEADGKLRSEETTVSQRSFHDGFTTVRLIEKNGKPLTPEERRQEEEQIGKRLAERKAMSQGDYERERRKSIQNGEWAKEVPEALRFKLLGEEAVDGRPCWIVEAVPRPGYHPRNMQARVFEKLKGRIWVDKADRELVKADAETFDSVQMGFGLLARMDKGTRFAVHRVKLPDGNWVIDSQSIRFGARVMLVKWMGNEITTQMSEFRHKSQMSASR